MADKLAMAGELGKFVGFDSLSGASAAGIEQSDVGSHDQMFNSDAHFMTVLKQLGKRDTTTKLKVCVCVCITMSLCLYNNVYMCVCVCARMCVCVCALCTYVCVHVHDCTCVYPHT